MDYNKFGTYFITTGKNKSIRVYDEATKTMIQEMRGNDNVLSMKSSHSSRVFACKVSSEDTNVILSGGWDNTVQIWDVRSGHTERYIYGPHICGDALDLAGNSILTGSWRTSNQLEIWDFRSGDKVENVAWKTNDKDCCIYAAQFSKEGNGRYILAGGSNANEARVFDRKQGNAMVGAPIQGFSTSIVSVDFCEVGVMRVCESMLISVYCTM
jgi:WD40 repeat protein